MTVRSIPLLVALLLGLGPAWATAELTAWRLEAASSSITVVATQLGGEFKGVFRRFDAEILFDSDHLDGSRVAVTVETGSLDTGNDQRDETARGQQWFDVSNHPVARYEAAAFRSMGDGSYEADGTLTIKGITRPVVLRFVLALSGEQARVAGRLTVRREDFALGTGEWASNGVIGPTVDVRVDVTAVGRHR